MKYVIFTGFYFMWIISLSFYIFMRGLWEFKFYLMLDDKLTLKRLWSVKYMKDSYKALRDFKLNQINQPMKR